MARGRLDSLEQVEVVSREAWRAWLREHHGQPESIWLVTYKKDRGAHVTYDEIVEEALCFGWVDSLARRLDEDRTMLLLSPRKPGSPWSGVNKRRVARLEALGMMAEAGEKAVEGAIADGSWTILDGPSALVIPDDLAHAFSAHPGSRERFEEFPPSARRAILEWIALAKRSETRARRVSETAEKASLGERANAWKK